MWASIMSRGTSWSARPCVNAKPALVVARAGKPSPRSQRALPTSHGFGMTKQPLSCKARKRATRSAWPMARASVVVAGHALGLGDLLVLHRRLQHHAVAQLVDHLAL